MQTHSRLQEMFLAYTDLKKALPDIDAIQRRLDRGWQIAKAGGEGYDVVKVQSDHYQVFKGSTTLLEDNSVAYEVTREGGHWACTCPDYEKAPSNLCKHRLAVMILERM